MLVHRFPAEFYYTSGFLICSHPPALLNWGFTPDPLAGVSPRTPKPGFSPQPRPKRHYPLGWVVRATLCAGSEAFAAESANIGGIDTAKADPTMGSEGKLVRPPDFWDAGVGWQALRS